MVLGPLVDSFNDGLSGPGGDSLPRGFTAVGDKVRISWNRNSNADVRGIKRRLLGELEQVRSMLRSVETMEARLNEKGYDNSRNSDRNLVGCNDRNAMSLKRVGVYDSKNEDWGNEGAERKKKIPKVDQGFRNLTRKSKVVGLLLGPDKNSSNLLKSCKTLLEKLMKHKHGWVFNQPVDVKALGLHDYYKIVKHPMDLGTVKNRLSKNWYKMAAEFAEAVRLTFNNAMLYNPKGQDVHVMAALLLKLFEEKWVDIENQYNLNRRAEIGNDSEFPTPVSRNVEAPAQYNSSRRVEMGNIFEFPAPMLKKVHDPAHIIDRRTGMSNNSALSAPISKKVLAPSPRIPSSPPPLDTRNLNRAESIAKPVDPKLKPSSAGQTGTKPVSNKPKARDPEKRDMKMEEKQKLSEDLQALPSEELAKVVQIVKKRSQGILQKDDEIELDIGSLDPETLWELDMFVANYKESLTKKKRKAELAAQSVEELDFAMQEDMVQPTVDAQDVPITVEYENAFPQVQQEEHGENVSESSSSSSDSGSSSSDSDDDSSSGSGSCSNPSPRN